MISLIRTFLPIVGLALFFFASPTLHMYGAHEKKHSQKRVIQNLREKKRNRYASNSEARAIPFSYLMGIAPEGTNPRRFDIPQKDLELLAQFENAYNQATPLLFPQNKKEEKLVKESYAKAKKPRIPHTIHFIWLGPKTFPTESIKNVQSWAKKHPDWTIYFWTDSPTRPLPIPTMKRRLVAEYSFGDLEKYIPQTNNWGEKSDLMRYIILYNEGGIYVDHDCLCYKSFKNLAQFFHFVTCFERPHYHQSVDTFVLPSNGLIAARPKHPILKSCIERICKVWDTIESKYSEDITSEASTKRVLERTYDSFVFATLKEWSYTSKRKDLVLPSTFFYSQKIFNKKILSELKRKGLIFSTHTYAGSWKPPKEKPSATVNQEMPENNSMTISNSPPGKESI